MSQIVTLLVLGLWCYLAWNARSAIVRDLRRFSVLRVVSLLWRHPWWGRDRGATL